MRQHEMERLAWRLRALRKVVTGSCWHMPRIMKFSVMGLLANALRRKDDGCKEQFARSSCAQTGCLRGRRRARQGTKDLGKLTARERLTALFDAASFVELNALNEDAGVVAGFGTIDGRGAYAFAQDFTVGLGAVGDAHAKKIAKVVELARDSGSPVIGIYDTAGAKLEEGAMALDAYARIGAALASASAWCPASLW